MEFYVYILYSQKIDRYYVGYTGDMLQERIRKHNTNHKGYTGIANDWELLYVESFSSKSDAMRRESQVKKRKSRKYLIQLIESAG